jgi:DNA-binding CsgD family transcriptional regulator
VTGLEHYQWPGHDAPVRTFSRTILEREAALSTLQVALDDAIDGHGRFVLLFGEAGIGKTAVVRAFQDAARGRVRVVSGACEALFTPRPLGPVHDIADEVGGPLLDALTAQSNRSTILGALLAELKATTTLAVLEDLHWADEATLDAIAFLGRRLDTTPCVLLATFRDDQLGPRHPLRLVIGELPSRLTVRVGLEPLSEAAVADLAREAGRSPLGLHAATGGNPFYVTEVLAADEDKIPETVRDAVLARAGRISSEGRRLLEAVAVVPGDVEILLVERLASATISQLDECLASGVLRATSRGVEFRHELARLAVEESLTPDRRIELNRMAFRAIIDAPSGELDLAALAHHADAAGDAEAVLHYAPPAAERAAELGAHREAAAQYARALRFSASLVPDAQAELYERLSYECYLTGEFDEAIAASTQALERYRMLGDGLKEGESLHRLSRLLWSIGRTPEASDLGLQAVALLESLPPGHELATAYAQLSALSAVMDDFEGVAVWSGRAAELAERLGDREILASARLNLSAAEYAAGSPGGRESLERELASALTTGLEEVAARAFNALVRIAARSREYEVVDRYLDAGFEYCRDRELGNFRQGLGAERARLLLDRGEWTSATDAANLVLSTARTSGMAPFLAFTVLGQVRARRGDPDVWEPFDRALAMAESSGEFQRLALVAAARSEAAWLAGDRQQTLEEARGVYTLAVERRHVWFAGELAYWQWKAGRRESPPGWIAEPYARQIGGDAAGAGASWAARGCPYEAARALAESDDEDALREALDVFENLGARPAAQRMRQALRERGASVPRGPRPATRENPANLTARELDVLALLAEGLRNAEIADRLVVSRRTIEHHVSAILRKLDARTRGEAVAEAARLGFPEERQAFRPT